MLAPYRHKRDFTRTAEPRGGNRNKTSHELAYVIQKHAASHLHYDFRLELDGVLKSWAVPKGPSLDPGRKSLAVQVEDHPLEYGSFEGTIPKGQYGGGSVLLWDRGTWEPLDEPHKGLKEGKLHFALHGEKLHGEWTLVRFHGDKSNGKPNWLLMKTRDSFASEKGSIIDEKPRSVKTRRRIEAIGQSKMPADIRPQLATWTPHPPQGDNWLHEVKLDGYRLIVRIEDGQAKLITRGGEDWTHRFKRLAAELSKIRGQAILDGEVVVLDEKGRSHFQLLQTAWKNGSTADPIIYVFDLLYLNGNDLREKPLIERKEQLKKLLDTLRAPRVKFSDHVRGDGQAVVDDACKMSLEGIVSKRTDARYVGGRTKTWLKSKCGYRQEFVILGYTDPRGSRQEFGAILLGYHDPQGKLVYAGRVGTGFDSDLLKQIKSKMASHARQTPPTDTAPPARERRNAHWIEPRLVAEIKFAGWTSDNMIRQGAFLGLRKDKPAAEIVREDQPAELTLKRFKEPAAPPAKLSHPDRIVFPGTKITKADVGKYYELVAARMMPHIVQRPLTLMRYPSGIGGPSFVQRHAAGTPPPGIEPIKGERDAQTYLTIRDPDGLQALVQMNAIEIHAWGCAPGEIEKPDRLVFDLDPHESLPWKQIVKAAMDMKEILESVKLRPLVKTTGGKGLHIVVPIKPTIDWEHAKSFSRQIAQELQRRDRSAYTTNLRKTERPGRVFIDYLRNGRSATSAAPYCLRARKGAPISMPVDWERLPSLKAANRFTLENVAKELKKSDPWSGFESNRVDLHKIVGAK